MDNTIYILFGVLFAVYVGISMMNRKKSKERKSRKFMEDYKRKEKGVQEERSQKQTHQTEQQ